MTADGTAASKILDVLRSENSKVRCAMVLGRSEQDEKRVESYRLELLEHVSFGYQGYLARHLGLKVVRAKPPSKAPKDGLDQFRRKRLGDDQVFYAADGDGTCFCIVTGHQFGNKKAMCLLKELQEGFKETTGVSKTKKLVLSSICRKYNEEGFQLKENHRGIRKKPNNSQGLKVSPTVGTRRENVATPTSGDTCIRPPRSFQPRSRSRQLEEFAKLAKSRAQGYRVRNRRLSSRRMALYRNGSGAASTASLNSRDDMLSFSWDSRSSCTDTLFIWDGLLPMTAMPTLFPYYESTGTSLPGHDSTVRSIGTTVRTRSCQFIQWGRNL